VREELEEGPKVIEDLAERPGRKIRKGADQYTQTQVSSTDAKKIAGRGTHPTILQVMNTAAESLATSWQ